MRFYICFLNRVRFSNRCVAGIAVWVRLLFCRAFATNLKHLTERLNERHSFGSNLSVVQAFGLKMPSVLEKGGPNGPDGPGCPCAALGADDSVPTRTSFRGGSPPGGPLSVFCWEVRAGLSDERPRCQDQPIIRLNLTPGFLVMPCPDGERPSGRVKFKSQNIEPKSKGILTFSRDVTLSSGRDHELAHPKPLRLV
jgi:hypothetical protein